MNKEAKFSKAVKIFMLYILIVDSLKFKIKYLFPVKINFSKMLM